MCVCLVAFCGDVFLFRTIFYYNSMGVIAWEVLCGGSTLPYDGLPDDKVWTGHFYGHVDYKLGTHESEEGVPFVLVLIYACTKARLIICTHEKYRKALRSCWF